MQEVDNAQVQELEVVVTCASEVVVGNLTGQVLLSYLKLWSLLSMQFMCSSHHHLLRGDGVKEVGELMFFLTSFSFSFPSTLSNFSVLTMVSEVFGLLGLIFLTILQNFLYVWVIHLRLWYAQVNIFICTLSSGCAKGESLSDLIFELL